MKKNNVVTTGIINQSQLRKMLNLSPSVIRHLKETNRLKFNRVGTEDIFDESSVKSFMDTFRRDDYLTIGECKKKLDRWNFYTFRPNWRNIYINPLGFYLTVKQLIRGGYGIPEEYQLKPKIFGTTQYISRNQFSHTLNWLRNVNHKVNPKSLNNFVKITTEPKKPKLKGLNGIRRIGQTNQPKPHPMIFPSMVCPLSPLTQ